MPTTRIKTERKKGFTLVESLVAISILTLSILGTYTAVQSSLQTATGVRNQITAFNLTQEAVEFIRNTRDENGLHNISDGTTNWMKGILVDSFGGSGPCNFGKVCAIDSYVKTIVNCPGGAGTCPYLKQNTNSSNPQYGLYGYSSGSDWVTTTFKREISFTQPSTNPGSEVLINVSITWTEKGVAKSFQISEVLMKFQ